VQVRESTAISARDRWTALPKRTLAFFLAADVLLVFMHAIVTALPQRPWNRPLKFLFGLNVESNIPTWYSSMQLLLIGVGLLVLTTWLFDSDGRVSRLRRFFAVGGLIFVYLSADEAGRVHEQFSAILQSWHWLRMTEARLIPAFSTQAARYGGGALWIPVFALIGVACLVWMWPQIRLALRLWSREARRMAIGFGVMLLGAVVVEGLGTLIPKTASLARAAEVGLEEGLEMVGATLILSGVVSVIAAVAPRVLTVAESTISAPDPVGLASRSKAKGGPVQSPASASAVVSSTSK
jgi:hypothetical protein